MTTITHRRLLCTALTLAAIAAGLSWRLAPLHLPWFAYKYGGSALWAVAIYWLLAAVLPHRPSLQIAFTAAVLAAALEISRLWHLPALDAFRLTSPASSFWAASSPQRTSPPIGLPFSPPLSSTICSFRIILLCQELNNPLPHR